MRDPARVEADRPGPEGDAGPRVHPVVRTHRGRPREPLPRVARRQHQQLRRDQTAVRREAHGPGEVRGALPPGPGLRRPDPDDDGRRHLPDEGEGNVNRVQPIPREGDREWYRIHHREFPRGEVPAQDSDRERDEGRGEGRPGPPLGSGRRGRRANRGEHRTGDPDPRLRSADLPGWDLHHEEGRRGGVSMADEEPKAAKKVKKTAVPEKPAAPKEPLPKASEIRAAKKAELVAWSDRYELS